MEEVEEPLETKKLFLLLMDLLVLHLVQEQFLHKEGAGDLLEDQREEEEEMVLPMVEVAAVVAEVAVSDFLVHLEILEVLEDLVLQAILDLVLDLEIQVIQEMLDLVLIQEILELMEIMERLVILE